MRSTYKIHKIDCQSCVMVIEGICEDTAGVTKAEVNATKKILTVEHDPSVNPSQLKQVLDTEGYPVEII